MAVVAETDEPAARSMAPPAVNVTDDPEMLGLQSQACTGGVDIDPVALTLTTPVALIVWIVRSWVLFRYTGPCEVALARVSTWVRSGAAALPTPVALPAATLNEPALISPRVLCCPPPAASTTTGALPAFTAAAIVMSPAPVWMLTPPPSAAVELIPVAAATVPTAGTVPTVTPVLSVRVKPCEPLAAPAIVPMALAEPVNWTLPCGATADTAAAEIEPGWTMSPVSDSSATVPL